MLTKEEEKALKLWSEGTYIVSGKDSVNKGLQSLIDRGYCRLGKARVGPLGIYTGEFVIAVTEAARASL